MLLRAASFVLRVRFV